MRRSDAGAVVFRAAYRRLAWALRPREMGHYYDSSSYPPPRCGPNIAPKAPSCAQRGDLQHQSGPQAGDLRTFLRRVRLWIMKILVIGSTRPQGR